MSPWSASHNVPLLMSHGSGSTWLHYVEPLIIPLLKAAAPFALRAILSWWIGRQREQVLTRREKVLIWAATLGVHLTKRSPLHSDYTTLSR